MPRARAASAAVAAVLVGVLAVACTPTDESSPPEPDQPEDAALRVTTLPAAGIDEETRAELESEVGDVLAGYVAGSFLGDYPRGDFVQGFAEFTNRAAGYAVVDIEQVTAVRFDDATSLRATRLEAELSFLVLGDEAVGATAWVDFAFEVVDKGEVTTVTLKGPISLDHRNDRWAVFGYRLMRDDSDALPTEAVS